MKKLLLVVFFLASIRAFAVGVPSQSTPWPQVDSDGHSVSHTYPVPVVGTFTIGSATFSASGALEVYPADYNTASTTLYTPTSSGAVVRVVVATAAKTLSLWATGTFEVYLGSTTVTASGVPVYNINSIPIGTSAVVMVGQTATNTNIQAIQAGQ